MKIDWASSFRSDGSRRRPPASTMHGWLAKMRGTLLGNESLRSRGMREMREAQSVRKYKAQKEKQRRVNSGSALFSFLRPSQSKKSAQTLRRPTQSRKSSSQRPPMPHRATGSSRTSARNARGRGGQRTASRPQAVIRPAMHPQHSGLRRGSGR